MQNFSTYRLNAINRKASHWLKARLTFVAVLALVAAGCGNGEADTVSPSKSEVSKDVESSVVDSVAVDGELYAAVNGERRIWYVTHLARDGEWQSGSFWRPMSLKDTTQVTLFGLPEKKARPTGKGDLMIGLVIKNEAGVPRVVSVDFTYFADGYTKTWTSEHGGEGTVMLNRYIPDGEYLDLGGGFSADVELPDLGNAATETALPRRFEISDGSFAVRVRQLQK